MVEGGHPFPDDLRRLAEAAHEVGGDAAWEAWISSPGENQAEASQDRAPGAATKVEDGLRRALGALSLGARRSTHEPGGDWDFR